MASTQFTYSPTTGTGNTIISVSADTTNTGNSDNSATITLTSGVNSATVSVKQRFKPRVAQGPTSVPATGGTITITAETEYDVVFRSVPLWVSVWSGNTRIQEGSRYYVTQGTSAYPFTISAETNTGAARSASTEDFNMAHYIGDTMMDQSYNVSKIQVIQAAGEQPTRNMVLSPTAATVDSGVVYYTIYVPTTACTFCGMTYTNSNASFPVTAAKDGNYISLTFSANTGAQRNTTLTFTLTDENSNTYSRTFSLTQNATSTPTEQTGQLSTVTYVEALNRGLLSIDMDLYSYNSYYDSTSFILTNSQTEHDEDMDIKYLSDGSSNVSLKILLAFTNGQGQSQVRNFDVTVEYGTVSVETVTTGEDTTFQFPYAAGETMTITIEPAD